jgi:hypothetical protein
VVVAADAFDVGRRAPEPRQSPVLWRKRKQAFGVFPVVDDLAAKKHGLKKTEAGITMKLKRGTFAAIFFLACIAALEREQVVLEEI